MSGFPVLRPLALKATAKRLYEFKERQPDESCFVRKLPRCESGI